jgi:hypothetical protein
MCLFLIFKFGGIGVGAGTGAAKFFPEPEPNQNDVALQHCQTHGNLRKIGL